MRHLPAILLVLAMGVPVLGVTASTAAAQGITGHVYDSETGDPVAEAAVIVRDRAKEEVARGATDADGEFRIELGATGLFLVSLERSGYASGVWASVNLRDSEWRDVEIVITPDDADNPGIVVNQEPVLARLKREGYYDRKRRSRGAFIEPTKEDIDERLRVDELIRRGTSRVRIENDVAVVRASRGGSSRCPLKVVLDGIDTGSVRLNGRRRFLARDIQAIEVYWSEINVPARWKQSVFTGARSYSGGQTEVCGVVLIWLR